MAELFGRVGGVSKGKGGSMHLFDVPSGFLGGYGIVGGHIPLATGAAYALRYRDAGSVCLCFFGDGAVNSGAFHEALNKAGLWGRQGLCPLLYVIENNRYAMGPPSGRGARRGDEPCLPLHRLRYRARAG
jgi:pyruvate dehydrogenase E1 component alpha subunit